MSTALVIIDMQKALLTGAFQAETVIGNVQRMIRAARDADCPVVFVQHNHASFEPMRKGGAGWAIHPSLEVRSTDIRVEKEASDAFYRTGLAPLLRDRDVTDVVLCGMMTEYCVDTTARSALSHDFAVMLAADAHTTGDSTLRAAEIIAHHNAALANVVHPTRRITVKPAAEVSFMP